MKLFRIALALFLLATVPASATSVFDYRIWGVNSGMAVKAPVVAATTGAITLSGAQTIDGVAVTDHLSDSTGLPPDRVLVKNQADQTTNGIWNVSASGAWTEASDFIGANNLVNGTIIIVARGNTNSGLWQLTTANPVVVAPDTIGASNITFAAYTATSASAILGSVCTTAGGIFDYNGSAYGCLAPPLSTPAFLMGNIGGVPSYVTSLASLPGSGGTLNLPVGPDTITANATAATLTNKTFDTAGTGNVFKINGQQISSVSGNTSKVATASGALTNTHCVSIDANGNFVDAGGACTTGGGGGTVATGTHYQVAYYTGTGTTVGGASTLVTDANGVLDIAGSTITSNDPVLSLAQTWNASGTTFNGIFENITNTASAAGSLLENLQIGGSTKWSIDKNGNVTNGTWEGSQISSTYLPTATGSALGLAEAGTNISVVGGVFSVATGSSSTKGVLQGDGSTITISAGVASCTTGTTSQLGCLEPDGSTITVSGGVISAVQGGGLKLVATVNASNATSVSFSSSALTNGYNNYLLVIDSWRPHSTASVSNGTLELLTSTDNGLNYATTGYANQDGAPGLYIDLGTFNCNDGSGNCQAGGQGQAIIWIGNINSTAAMNFRVSNGFYDYGASSFALHLENYGFFKTSAAVNNIKILLSSGNLDMNAHLYALQGT